MNLVQRISRLITANINHLLDQAEDPEVMVKQLIRDMEEALTELHRDTVRAVARQRQLEKQIAAAEEQVKDLEAKARSALIGQSEPLSRQYLIKKLHIQQTCENLREEWERAKKFAAQLRSDLSRLKDRFEEANRKKEELIRRHRAAEAQLRAQEIAHRSHETLSSTFRSLSELEAAADSFEASEESIIGLESKAQVMQEILDPDIGKEIDLERMAEADAVEKEIQRLKGELQI